MAGDEIVPFKVDIPKEEFERLKRKLRDTRLPPKEIVPDAGSRYGMRAFSNCCTSDNPTDALKARPTNGPPTSSASGATTTTGTPSKPK